MLGKVVGLLFTPLLLAALVAGYLFAYMPQHDELVLLKAEKAGAAAAAQTTAGVEKSGRETIEALCQLNTTVGLKAGRTIARIATAPPAAAGEPRRLVTAGDIADMVGPE